MTRLLVSFFLTTTCSWTITFLIPLEIYDITTSAVWTAFTYGAAMLPFLIVTPFAGVWSDRYSKRTLLIAGDAVSLSLAVAFYVVMEVSSGTVTAMLLLILAFASSTVSAIHHPVFQSIAPELLAARSLPRFNAVVHAFNNAIYVIAPAFIAAAMSYLQGRDIVLWSALGFALSLPVLWGIRSGRIGRVTNTTVIADLKEGVKYVIGDTNLRSFSVLFACVNFGLSIISANLVFIYKAIYGVSQGDIGYYFALTGLGAVVGSLCAPRLMAMFGDARIIIGCCFAAGVAAFVAATATTAVGYAAVWSMATACASTVVVTFFTFRQRVVPAELLGRTVAVTRVVSYAAIPLASITGGLLMDRFKSAPLIMVVGGVAICAGSAVGMLAPSLRRSVFSTAAAAQIQR